MSLEKELQTFQKELPRLLIESPGKYALVKGDSVESVWATYEDAIQEGYNRFELEPFMVKRIQLIERVKHITRNVTPICRSSTSN